MKVEDALRKSNPQLQGNDDLNWNNILSTEIIIVATSQVL